jgi:hypothetical protein
MKLRIMVEVTHQGKTERKLSSVEVPEKTLKLHAMLCEDASDLRANIAADVMANAMSAVSGPAARKLSPGAMDGPPKSGPGASAMDKKMAETLGLDLLEHMDQVDGRAPMGQGGAPGPGPIGYGSGRRQ